MDRSFEEIFINALVTSLTKNAAGLVESGGGISELAKATPEQKAEFEAFMKQKNPMYRDPEQLPFMEKMLGKLKGAAGAVKEETVRGGRAIGRGIRHAWRTGGPVGKGAMIAAPTAAVGIPAAAALIHALKGKKKEE